MESYIYKYSNNLFNNRWQKRYFKLINKQLLYTLTDDDSNNSNNYNEFKTYIDCNKIIELGNGNKENNVDLATHWYIVTKKRTYLFKNDDAAETKAWLACLHVYCEKSKTIPKPYVDGLLACLDEIMNFIMNDCVVNGLFVQNRRDTQVGKSNLVSELIIHGPIVLKDINDVFKVADVFKRLLCYLPETILTDKLSSSIIKDSLSANDQDIFHVRDYLLRLPSDNLKILKGVIQMFIVLCATPNMDLNSLAESLGPLLFKNDSKEIYFAVPIVKLFVGKFKFFFEGDTFQNANSTPEVIPNSDIQEVIKPIKFLPLRTSVSSNATTAFSEISSYCDSFDLQSRRDSQISEVTRSQSVQSCESNFSFFEPENDTPKLKYIPIVLPTLEKIDFNFNFDEEPVNATLNTSTKINANDFAVSLISPAGIKTRNANATFDLNATILSGIIKNNSIRKNSTNTNVRDSILKVYDGKTMLNLMIEQYSNEANSSDNLVPSTVATPISTLEKVISAIKFNEKDRIQPLALDDESDDETVDSSSSYKVLSSKSISFPKTPTILSKCNTPINGTPSSWIKSAVSKEKNRFIADGFDLDLTYITDHIIAMGFPSENIEGIYRNSMDQVQKFFESRHKDHYKIYNLCSEKFYDASKFHGRLMSFPFDDHNCPYFDDLEFICQDIANYLGKHPSNVCALHCKAGKGRTGLMISIYLLFSGNWKSAEDAMNYYAHARTKNMKGITIPSQQRWVRYYEILMKLKSVGKHLPPPVPKKLIKILIYSHELEFDQITIINHKTHYSSDNFSEGWKQKTSFGWELKFESLLLTKDFKITFNQMKYFGIAQNLVLYFWLNTQFIVNNYQELTKIEIDKLLKNKTISNNFKIELFFQNTNPNIEIDYEDQMSSIDIREAKKHKRSNTKFNLAQIASKMLDDIDSDDICFENLSSVKEKTPSIINNTQNDIISSYDYDLANPVLQELNIFLKSNLPSADIERLNKLDNKLKVGGDLHFEFANKMKSGKPIVNLRKLRDFDSKHLPTSLKFDIQNRNHPATLTTNLSKLTTLDNKTTSLFHLLQEIQIKKNNFTVNIEKLDALDNKKIINPLHQELQNRISSGISIVNMDKIDCFDNKPLITDEEKDVNLNRNLKRFNPFFQSLVIDASSFDSNKYPIEIIKAENCEVCEDSNNEINFDNCESFKKILDEEIENFKTIVKNRMDAEYSRLKAELEYEKLKIKNEINDQRIKYSNELNTDINKILELSLESSLNAALKF